MRKKQIVITGVALIIATLQTQAATVALWDFEQGVSGTPVNGQAFSDNWVADQSGNGNTMRGWDATYGPSYTNVTADGSGFAASHNGGQDGYTEGTPVNTWTPEVWTIETSVRLDALGNNRTVLGKDGNTFGGPASDFYLQTYGAADVWRIDFATVGGQRVTIDTPFGATAGDWTGLAITSDGTDVNLWIDQTDGNGYQLAGTTALTGLTAADNALEDAGGANWTLGRGWWNGGFGDHLEGSIDNVRFSDTALDSSEFLAVIPEPATFGTIIAFGGGMLFIRRKFMI